MIPKTFLPLLAANVLFSCGRDIESNKEKYVVSASKMISLAGSNWSNTEQLLKDKIGYEYIAAQPQAVDRVKAVVRLPAVDDSSKLEAGAIYLNITPDNIASYTSYATEPISQSSAYAMMLNYNTESLKTLTNISHALGGYIDNNIGGGATVESILARVKNGETPEQLSITYRTLPRTVHSLLLFKQPDGRYIFEFRSNW